MGRITPYMKWKTKKCLKPPTVYIYIYTVGGVGSPIGRHSGSLNLRKNSVYCGKMEIFDVVHFILDVFQLRIKHFSSVEVEFVDGPWQHVFFCVLFSPLELRGAHLVIYQRSLEKGIMYCVSTGILMWCCFSLGILSVFTYHQNFPVLWVSCFFCFSRPMVLLWTLTLAGGNFSLPAAESVRVLSRHFPNQAFCLDSALLERCDVRLGRWQPSAIRGVSAVTLLHERYCKLHERCCTPPHPTPPHNITVASP